MLIDIVKVFIPIFVIVSPIGAVPLFLGMTQNDAPERRRRTAWIAAIASTLALALACLIGQHIFDFFGVSIDAFRIAGGILLFIIALDFVQVRQTRMRVTEPEIAEGVEKQEVGIIPLAIPMLAGPGSIATVMVLGGSGKGVGGMLPLLIAIVLTGIVTLVVLLLAGRMQKHLAASTLGIVLRLEGLLLAAIAVQMVVTGVTNLVITSLQPVAGSQ